MGGNNRKIDDGLVGLKTFGAAESDLESVISWFLRDFK